MKPIYCRIGSKYLMAEDIIIHFPDHLIYVEPFIGGGGVYWKKEPSPAEIINDLDTDLINDYKLIKTVSTDPTKYKQDLDTIQKQEAFLNKKTISKEDKITEQIIRRCNGFGSQYIGKNNRVYKASNPYSKLRNIKDYKSRISKTIIKNEDYKKIIHDYDTDRTLFYLDPPYENSKGLYEEFSMDFVEMARILKNIKGKFILSINDSPYIRKVFKEFKIIQIKLKTTARKHSNLGGKDRIELLIMNF